MVQAPPKRNIEPMAIGEGVAKALGRALERQGVPDVG